MSPGGAGFPLKSGSGGMWWGRLLVSHSHLSKNKPLGQLQASGRWWLEVGLQEGSKGL